MSTDYEKVTEAAKAFDNVTIVNSGCLSSATGIMVLIAYKLAQQNVSVPEIVAELERVKNRIKCSFVIDTTEYMAKIGFINPLIHKVAHSFNLHPSIGFKDDNYSMDGIWMGSTRRAYRKFIHRAFSVDIIPDPDILFITYVNVPTSILIWIKEEISKIAYFENVVFKQASAAVSAGCGSGTFGIMYFAKGNKSYNIGTFVTSVEEDRLNDADEEDYDITDNDADSDNLHGFNESDRDKSLIDGGDHVSDEDGSAAGDSDGEAGQKESATPEPKWYEGIEGIDGEAGIKNAASEELYRSLLEMFYTSIPDKFDEIEGLYLAEDWDNYTIKIHALKSSLRLVGALELGDRAQLLEDAGKEQDATYIHENHAALMKEYVGYRKLLAPVFGESVGEEGMDAPASEGAPLDEIEQDKPAIDNEMLHELYESLRAAADEIDSDTVDALLGELSRYSLSEEEDERYNTIRKCAANFDYDGIIESLN